MHIAAIIFLSEQLKEITVICSEVDTRSLPRHSFTLIAHKSLTDN